MIDDVTGRDLAPGEISGLLPDVRDLGLRDALRARFAPPGGTGDRA